jgi:hypothetical protein
VGNAFLQGFYWPTAVADATRIVRSYRGCQFYARQTHLPAQTLQTIPITWSFAVWGLDLVGPLQKAPGGFTHLLVAIDKFSKWIEVRPLTSIGSEQAVAFFTNIIYRFGVRPCASRESRMGLRQTKTGRPCTWNISSEESCPSTRPKLGDWLGAPSRSFYWVMKESCTTAAPQAFSNDAYLSPKDKSCYKKYTRGLAITMQHLEPSWETLSDKVSTGRPRWPTPLGLYAPAEGVNSTRDRRTCPLRPCRQYLSLGRLSYGVWTSSVLCRRHPGASCTCWSPSTNSPSGSKSDP